MYSRRGFGILTIVYIVIGAFVAGANDYFERLGNFQPILSALLAIFLWPLVLLGVDLHIGR
jgi:cell shape-determining protein MreD